MAELEPADPAPPVEQMKVLWYGHVQKIGRNLGSQNRIIFLSESQLFVCLPAGGVTRSISIGKILRVTEVPPAVCQVSEAGQPELVVALESAETRHEFIEQLFNIRAALGTQGAPIERCQADMYSFEGHQSSVRRQAQLEKSHQQPVIQSQSSTPAHDSQPRSGSSPFVPSGINSDPIRPPGVPPAPRSTSGGPSPSRATPQSRGASSTPFGDIPPARHVPDAHGVNEQSVLQNILHGAVGNEMSTSVERPTSTTTATAGDEAVDRPKSQSMSSTPMGFVQTPRDAMGSSQVGTRPTRSTASSRAEDPIQPTGATGYSPEERGGSAGSAALPFDMRQNVRERQLHDLREAVQEGVPVVDSGSVQQLSDKIGRQQRIIDELKHTASTGQTAELKRDLEHSKSLIQDLQTALRSQEQTFAEMLRAQEGQRVSDDIRKSLEKQVAVLMEERDGLKSTIAQRDEEIELLKKDARQNEKRFSDELETVRQAFLQYDSNVGDYLEQMRIQHHRQLDEMRQDLLNGGPSAAAASSSSYGTYHQHPPTPHRTHESALAVAASTLAKPKATVDATALSPVHAGSGQRQQQQQAQRPARAPMPTPPRHHQQQGDTMNDDGVDAQELRTQLLKHLNTYANQHFHLPATHPPNNDVGQRAYGMGVHQDLSVPPHRPPVMAPLLQAKSGAHTPGGTVDSNVRDRSIL